MQIVDKNNPRAEIANRVLSLPTNTNQAGITMTGVRLRLISNACFQNNYTRTLKSQALSDSTQPNIQASLDKTNNHKMTPNIFKTQLLLCIKSFKNCLKKYDIIKNLF